MFCAVTHCVNSALAAMVDQIMTILFVQSTRWEKQRLALKKAT
jgi:hypothetical protein